MISANQCVREMVGSVCARVCSFDPLLACMYKHTHMHKSHEDYSAGDHAISCVCVCVCSWGHIFVHIYDCMLKDLLRLHSS